MHIDTMLWRRSVFEVRLFSFLNDLLHPPGRQAAVHPKQLGARENRERPATKLPAYIIQNSSIWIKYVYERASLERENDPLSASAPGKRCSGISNRLLMATRWLLTLTQISVTRRHIPIYEYIWSTALLWRLQGTTRLISKLLAPLSPYYRHANIAHNVQANTRTNVANLRMAECAS